MIQCTACRYCIPVCPMHIPITELLNLYENDNINHTGRLYERVVEGKGKASACLKCSKCEQVCSQHLPIKDYIEQVSKKYEINKDRTPDKVKELLKLTGLANMARRIKRRLEDNRLN